MDAPFISLRFAVEGDIQLSRAFDTMGQKIDDLTPVLKKIADSFYKHMEDVFEREGASGNRQRWHPLNPRYAAWKRKRYPGAKILVLTGELKESLTNPKSSKAYLAIDRLEMSIGTSVSYAMKHQLGIKEGKYVLPQRKIIELTEEVKKEYREFLENYQIG